MSEFVVDAASLIDWQTCRRKWVLQREWRLARWRPKVLFDTLLRRGIIELTRQVSVGQAAVDAKTVFMQTATDPGLDIVGGNPYELAREWCTLLDTVLHGIGKTTLPVLHDPERVHLAAGPTFWKPTSWADDSGQLHRWLTVDQWDGDALSRELHSWRTVGDVVACQVPMILHVIVIGQQRAGRHGSPWSRAYRHPGLASLRLQFVKPDGTRWKPIYFVDQHDMDAEEWVDAAWKQGAIQPLLVDVPVAVPPDNMCGDTLVQMADEAASMRALVDTDYLSVPMSRNACDLYGVPCAYQNVCYTSKVVPVDKIGLYVLYKSGYSTPIKEVPSNAHTAPTR